MRNFINVNDKSDKKSPSDLKGVGALNPEWNELANGVQYIGNSKRVVMGHYLEINFSYDIVSNIKLD